MPRYDYYCEANDQTVEVIHSMSQTLKTWGQVCHFAGIDKGDTPGYTAVKRLISAPNINVPMSDTSYRDAGFTKLVRRDKGVYENVTASGNDKRYMKADDQSSVPKLTDKIRD